MPIGGRLVNKLGAGIGMATEVYHGHKNKLTSDEQAHAQDSKSQFEHDSKDLHHDDSDLDDDQSLWDLDDASNDLADSPPEYSEFDDVSEQSPDQETAAKGIADLFLKKYPVSLMQRPSTPLPLPIIIPQRRPREASRGFVLAYPPLLESHAGVSQNTFIEFLTALNATCKASSAFDAINMAAFAAMFTPSIIAHVTSISVRKASQAAEEGQSRYQRNTFLDKVNETFFRPRGLWCMIVTWKPESKQDQILHLDLRNRLASTAGIASQSQKAPEPGQTHGTINILSTSSGTTTGPMELDDCAPLIYPTLDRVLTSQTSSTTTDESTTKSKLSAHQATISEYIDRRSRAKFSTQHPDTPALTDQTQRPDKFASRFADPNHPTNSGTILGLLTGGTFDPRAKRRGRVAERRARHRGRPFDDDDRKDAEMGRTDLKGRKTEDEGGIRGRVERITGHGADKRGVRRMIRQDVCYLMVVDFPKDLA